MIPTTLQLSLYLRYVRVIEDRIILYQRTLGLYTPLGSF